MQLELASSQSNKVQIILPRTLLYQAIVVNWKAGKSDAWSEKLKKESEIYNLWIVNSNKKIDGSYKKILWLQQAGMLFFMRSAVNSMF